MLKVTKKDMPIELGSKTVQAESNALHLPHRRQFLAMVLFSLLIHQTKWASSKGFVAVQNGRQISFIIDIYELSHIDDITYYLQIIYIFFLGTHQPKWCFNLILSTQKSAVSWMPSAEKGSKQSDEFVFRKDNRFVWFILMILYR